MCKFASIELSVIPFVRQRVKQHIYKYGYLQTSPTEEGKKVIDVFHPSYRVKHIKDLTLETIMNNAKN
jgi:hypothetical protein